MTAEEALRQAQNLLGSNSTQDTQKANRTQSAKRRASGENTELNTSLYRKQMDFGRSVHSSPSDINQPRSQNNRNQIHRKTGI